MLGFLKKALGIGSSFRTPHEAHPVLGPAARAARGGDVRPLMKLYAEAKNDHSLRYASVEACMAEPGEQTAHALTLRPTSVSNSVSVQVHATDDEQRRAGDVAG